MPDDSGAATVGIIYVILCALVVLALVVGLP